MAKLPALLVVYLSCLVGGPFIYTGIVSAQDKVSVGCFGSAGSCLHHSLKCSDTSRVAIEKALYGHKTWLNCTTGVIDCYDPCCRYLPTSDCFHVFMASHITATYRNCTEHACEFRTPRLVDPCTKSGTSFQAVSSYSVVEFECVDESMIIPMCGSVVSKSGTSVSVMYDSAKQYKDSDDYCWCSVSQISNRPVTIEGIDLRLNDSSSCGQLQVLDNSVNWRYDCTSPPLWPSLTLGQTSSHYTHVLMTGKPEFVWIRFRADETLHVTCSMNAQHTTTTTITTTTSLPTTSTVTYPQASLDVDTRTPVDSTTSEASTTSAVNRTLETGSTSSESTTAGAENTGERGAGGTSSSQGMASDVTVGAAVGGVIGAILLLVVVVLIVRWCRRDRTQASPKDMSPTSTPAVTSNTYDNALMSINGVYKQNGAVSASDPKTFTPSNPTYDSFKPDPEEHHYAQIQSTDKAKAVIDETDNAVSEQGGTNRSENGQLQQNAKENVVMDVETGMSPSGGQGATPAEKTVDSSTINGKSNDLEEPAKPEAPKSGIDGKADVNTADSTVGNDETGNTSPQSTHIMVRL